MLYIIVRVAKILVILLLCLSLFFWLAAHASGHKIPSKTNWYFGVSAVLLTGLAVTLRRKSVKMKS